MKAEHAKLPGAGIGPKQCPGKCEAEMGAQPINTQENDDNIGRSSCIRERYNEIKEIVRKERGLSEEEFEGALKAGHEEAVRQFAPLRRAIGIRFRAIREERGFSRNQLAARSNVPPREIGRIERGVSDFSVGDMLRLCLALNCKMEKLLEDVRESCRKLSN